MGLFLFSFVASHGYLAPLAGGLLYLGTSRHQLSKAIHANKFRQEEGSQTRKNNRVTPQSINQIKAVLPAGPAFTRPAALALFEGTLAEPGSPILVVHAAANPFSKYPTEILLAEGLNAFASADIAAVTAGMLSSFDVVIVGDISLTAAQVTMFTDWTNAGGTLIALSPDPKLAPLLGLTPAGGTLTNKYMLVNTGAVPGRGIESQTMQYQCQADMYNLNGATMVATLYQDPNTPTSYPAVTLRTVGAQGGEAIAFTYDLARSVVYTRQGNPDWAGQERDGIKDSVIRSDDQYFPNWVNLSKVAIPMADEQQRLLANIIVQSARKPLPRFWYLPRGLKAAVVMTGDDHGNGGTIGRFNQYKQLSDDNSPEAVAEWRAIRGTSYIYPNTPISNDTARALEQQGFEIALHVSTDCQNYSPGTLEQNLTAQLAEFQTRFPNVSAPVTNRTHCIAWSDWHSQPRLEASKGIRMDANYYYYPSEWVLNRPGMFSGSGIPMRFADTLGNLIDCYQLTTQLTDESDQSFPFTIDQLLDKAIGPEGYYGIFCANMHTDAPTSERSDHIIVSAKARNVPVITTKQALTWVDGRNGSSFGALRWKGNQLSFSITVGSGARSLEGMLPITASTGQLVSLTVNGTTLTPRTETIKGIDYAFFPAMPGTYVATYNPLAPPNSWPTVAITTPTNESLFPEPAAFTLTANAADADGTVAKVEFFQDNTWLGEALASPYSFNWSNVQAGTYSLIARATDNDGVVTTSAPVAVTVKATCPCTVFRAAEAPAGSLQNDGEPIQVGMRFRSSVNGNVTGVRFYKQAGNTGTHTGQLYSNKGTLLAEAMFVNETASGWQEIAFSSPVPITADTTYVVAYHSSLGYYSGTNAYFATEIDRTPLRALVSWEDGPNGVYLETSMPAFPTNTFGATNYWVDLVFESDTAPPNQPPTVALTSPANGASFTVPASIDIVAIAADADGTVTKVEFFEGNNRLGAALSSPYGIRWKNVRPGTYLLTARVADNAGAIANSASVTVTVNDVPTGCPCTVFQATDAPSGPLLDDNRQPLQLGMKFRSSVDGFVSGVRFYKQLGNGGTHIGQLYNSTGLLLAEATFVNETASGWQQVNFSTPVPITANTTYVITYHSSSGYYSADDLGFDQPIVNGVLTGLQNGADGLNGLYLVTSTPAFPTRNYLSSNYYVDAVFDTSPSTGTAAAGQAVASPEVGLVSRLPIKEGVGVYPNPVTDKAMVRFILVTGGPYTLGLYDAKGRLVVVLRQGHAKAGEPNTIVLDGAKLARGIYLIRLQTSKDVRTARLLRE